MVRDTLPGSDAPLAVRFREVDPFNLWLWLRLPADARAEQRELLEEVLKAWYIMGRLGGFSSQNAQVAERAAATGAVSHMPYAPDARDDSAACFHAMGDCEYRAPWLRCWFDLGTSDELALDVLINAVSGFSKERVAPRLCGCARGCAAAC